MTREEIIKNLKTIEEDGWNVNSEAIEAVKLVIKSLEQERNQSLDDLHDYASGNDLKRALGHPELQKERELPKAPLDTLQVEKERGYE